MLPSRNRNRKGYTLVELLIVLAVILTVGAMVVPSVRRYWQYYQLDAATRTLASSLELARYTAISKNVHVVAAFYVAARYYEVFEDPNGNEGRDSGEALLGAYPLPSMVEFSGVGLLGPPASPSGAVADPITFPNDRVVFNAKGKLENGLGCVYLKNASNDATALSFNLAGRMKIYRWDRASSSWK